jgi:hypothetical protein
MALGTGSNCINHPAVEAVARCKQCSRPVCSACLVSGPTGRFCSGDCKAKHEVFMRRAAELDTRSRGSLFAKLRSLLFSVVFIILVAGVIMTVASIIDIPVLSDVTRNVRSIIGI